MNDLSQSNISTTQKAKKSKRKKGVLEDDEEEVKQVEPSKAKDDK